MAKINAGDVIQKLIRGLGLSPTADKVPTEVAEKVLPVFNVNPDPEVETKTGVASDTTSGTISTTSTTKRTFITSVVLSIAKDVHSTSLFSDLRAFPKGKSISSLILLRYEPLTAGNIHDTLTFTPAIELEKGTAISVRNSTATASIDTHGVISYYEIEEV